MRRTLFALSIASAVGCDHSPEVTLPAAASLTRQASESQYDVVTLDPLGGTVSRGSGINNLGWVAGYSNLTNNAARHATLWTASDAAPIDLGSLGGPLRHSSAQWPGVNNNGMIVGISHTAIPDTLGEDWSCSAFLPASDRTCVGFVWEEGVMKPLPTLGGDHGFATGLNNNGQVVGWAETRVVDPTCDAPAQVLQFREVMWEPKKGTMRELPPWPGDSTSAATAINQRGQVVGISGECDVAVGRFSAQRAVLWDPDGTMTNIGGLGGISWHTPMAINERGDIVGFSNPSGDANGEFMVRAFLWTKAGGMRSLGTLDGDATSQALGINSSGQVVGVSCNISNVCRGVLWENGVLHELTQLLGPSFPDSVASAQHINDAGIITGRLVQKSTGRSLAFVATPR
jgi:probable HAF family extracellular repeat protein